MAHVLNLLSEANIAGAKAAGHELPHAMAGGVFTDPAKTTEFVKSMAATAKVLVISSDFDLATQNKAKSDAQAALPGIQVMLVPQGVTGADALKWVNEQKPTEICGP